MPISAFRSASVAPKSTPHLFWILRIPDVLFSAILERSRAVSYGKELELSFPEQFLSIHTFEYDTIFDSERYSGREPGICAVTRLLTQKFGAALAGNTEACISSGKATVSDWKPYPL